MPRLVSHAAPLAALSCAAAVAGFGAAFDVFSQWRHPIGLLGASAVPRAGAFNLFAFILPGLLAAAAATGLRSRLADASWRARLGAQALMLSGLAFTAQGLLPLDSFDLHGSRSRLHAAAWTAWWLATGVGGALLASTGRQGPQRPALAVAACAAATLVFALAAPLVLPDGLSQRLGFASWFAALWLGGRLSRSAA